MVNDTTVLLDLDGVSVVQVERPADGGQRVHLVTADETARACPACRVFATRVKGSSVTRPRDLPYGVDAPGHGGLFGQVEGRTVADILAWLATTDLDWRKGIGYIARGDLRAHVTPFSKVQFAPRALPPSIRCPATAAPPRTPAGQEVGPFDGISRTVRE